jgi:fatty acid desaturase
MNGNLARERWNESREARRTELQRRTPRHWRCEDRRAAREARALTLALALALALTPALTPAPALALTLALALALALALGGARRGVGERDAGFRRRRE